MITLCMCPKSFVFGDSGVRVNILWYISFSILDFLNDSLQLTDSLVSCVSGIGWQGVAGFDVAAIWGTLIYM